MSGMSGDAVQLKFTTVVNIPANCVKSPHLNVDIEIAHDNGVVEMISEHTHRESTPYSSGPQLVDADRKDRFTNLEDIAKRAGQSFMVFKEL